MKFEVLLKSGLLGTLDQAHRRPFPQLTTLPLRIALKQSNIESIDEHLYDDSHPESANYGKHWTAGEISQKFSPSEQSVSTVRDWLVENGLTSERIRSKKRNGYKEHVACEAYHPPEHISTHVDFVLPSVNFDVKLKCDQYITPICLRALYELVHEPVATEKNSYDVVEYTPQAYLQSDLKMFAMNYSTDLLGKEPVMVNWFRTNRVPRFRLQRRVGPRSPIWNDTGHWQAKRHSLPDW
ncbi:Pro-kumamolisin, activation domain-containing protein [Suillus americanus]|nr:Pro-kumamolisin, activation domain-containing protein [Suillus americanus]